MKSRQSLGPLGLLLFLSLAGVNTVSAQGFGEEAALKKYRKYLARLPFLYHTKAREQLAKTRTATGVQGGQTGSLLPASQGSTWLGSNGWSAEEKFSATQRSAQSASDSLVRYHWTIAERHGPWKYSSRTVRSRTRAVPATSSTRLGHGATAGRAASDQRAMARSP